MEQRFSTLLLASVLLLLTMNLIYLDIVVFSDKRRDADTSSVDSALETQSCPIACTSIIDQRLSSITPQAGDVVLPTPDVAPMREAPIPAGPKEFTISLGSGKGKSEQYEAPSGMEVTIDTSNYPPIKKAIFEASMRIPSGVGWMHAKLYNATEKHDVWGSELVTESDSSVGREALITLDPGENRYQVFVKSTLRADAYIDNARIRIITN